MSKKIDLIESGFLSRWLNNYYVRENVPGFVVAVAKDGNVILNEAYGYANIEKKEKMTTTHLFRVASHSKTFTATAIMQLQEQGKLKIDDQVAEYLPWLKDHKDKRFLNVTIRQLLSHGAGIIRDGYDQGFWSLDVPYPDGNKLQEEILKYDLVIENNLKMKYSNYGYSLLGLLVEAVSGVSYNEFVKSNIVQSLNLENTGPEYTDEIVDSLATGYSRINPDKSRTPIIRSINTNAMSSATGFYSSASDLCKYFSGHIVGSGMLMNDESKKEMQRTQWKGSKVFDDGEYGLGLDIDFVDGHRVFGHSGGFPGFTTRTWVYPKEQIVVTVLFNCLGVAAGQVGRSVMKTALLSCLESPKADESLKPYQGRFEKLSYSIDFIVHGNKLLATSTSTMFPLDVAEELERVEGNKFKIIKTSSYASEGEMVEFMIDQNGKVESVIYAGARLLPQDVYSEQFGNVKEIGGNYE